MIESEKKIRFDLVISFDSPNRLKTFNNAINKVKETYPDYEIIPVMDTDFSES